MRINPMTRIACIGLTFAAMAVAATTPAASACSVRYTGPPTPYSDILQELRTPTQVAFIRSAEAIYVGRRDGAKTASTPFEYGMEKEAFYATDFRFKVVETLKGPDTDTVWYRSNASEDTYRGLPIVDASGNIAWDSDRYERDASGYGEFLPGYGFWTGKQKYIIGEMVSPGDCQTYVYFRESEDYLIFVGSEGEILAAQSVGHLQDQWLDVVRYVLSNPGATHLGDATIRQLFEDHGPLLDRVTVLRCGASPKVREEDLIWEKTETFTPLSERNYEGGVDPYSTFSFNRSTCKRSAKYLVVHYGQWFPIDDEGFVELADLASSMRIIGSTRVSVEDLVAWSKSGWDD